MNSFVNVVQDRYSDAAAGRTGAPQQQSVQATPAPTVDVTFPDTTDRAQRLAQMSLEVAKHGSNLPPAYLREFHRLAQWMANGGKQKKLNLKLALEELLDAYLAAPQTDEHELVVVNARSILGMK